MHSQSAWTAAAVSGEGKAADKGGNAGSGQRPGLPGRNLATAPLATRHPVLSPTRLEHHGLCAQGDGCSSGSWVVLHPCHAGPFSLLRTRHG
jgi:hypothetical protein